jgi:hypothetical protein
MQFRMTIDLAGEDMLTLDDVITALQRNGGTVTGSTAILTAGESAQIFDGNDNKVGQWQVIDDVPGAGDEGPNGLEYAAMKRAEKEAFAADACAEYASRSGLTRGTRAVPSCGSRRFPRTGTNAVAGSRSADGDCFPSANAITMWATPQGDAHLIGGAAKLTELQGLRRRSFGLYPRFQRRPLAALLRPVLRNQFGLAFLSGKSM